MRLDSRPGAVVKAYEVDVLDRTQMTEALRRFDEEFGLDILIANAGGLHRQNLSDLQASLEERPRTRETMLCIPS